ncbi:MAG TPA: hypothetical protein VG900_04365 [Hyphomicrobiaceae bacterium]|jgi:ElaB/YqjD/DUF883 family membrane-anchored ribosome-binding protein|nr:hypothetical protein [Hyphomicrobiaceae bacterium]
MVQPGPSDYRSSGSSAAGASERGEHSSPQALDRVREKAQEMGDAARTAADDLAHTIRQHPYASMLIAAGLAFSLGALWKMGRSRPISRLEALRAQLPDLSRAEEFLRRLR